MSTIRNGTDQPGAPRRRRFLAEVAAAALALPFLPWARKAGAQTYYDQYGRPVAVGPGTVTPVAPAPGYGYPTAPASAYGYPPPAYGAVSGTRQVARRTARRTGRREGVREDVWDEIDD